MTHSHSHTVKENRFIFSIILTGLIFLAELIGGLWTGSLALLSDSAHVLMDAFALGLSYLALRAAALPANDRHTYGYHRLQVLAALANGATLLLIAFEILREACTRLQNPGPVLAGPMLVIAVVGLVVNLVVAFALPSARPPKSWPRSRSACTRISRYTTPPSSWSALIAAREQRRVFLRNHMRSWDAIGSHDRGNYPDK